MYAYIQHDNHRYISPEYLFWISFTVILVTRYHHSLGEDTWIIKFFLSGPGTEDSRNSSILWNNLAARLEGVASVGSFDLGSDRGERGDR